MTPVKPNGTDAKEIALHFFDMTTGKATPAIMGKTINQVKSILRSGYTKEEIIKTIDYIVDVKGVNMYSFGYVNASINSILMEIKEKEKAEKEREQRKEIEKQVTASAKEVKADDESKERNRNKLRRFGVQSRFGEKFDFDMFEESRKDN